MNTFKTMLCIASLVAALTVAGCKESTTSATGSTVYGAAQPMGKGTAKVVVVTDNNNKPVTIGIVLSDSVLIGLPAVDSTINLALPASMAVAPFTYVAMNWNVHGHEPAAIYGTPHFDFHFFITAKSKVDVIIPGNDTVPVPAQNIPKDYFTGMPPGVPPQAVPAMGVHYLDSLSPELKGATFTSTFIYGFYRGESFFLEPMISKAYLDTKPTLSADVKQPTAYQKTGYYPLKYNIKYDAAKKEYWITLDNLTSR